MKWFLIVIRLCFILLLLSCLVIVGGLVTAHNVYYMGDLAYIGTSNGIKALYIMDIERGFKMLLDGNFMDDCCLTWSPDGQTLAFVRDTSEDGSTDIFSLNFRSPIQRLTNVAGVDLYPAYSPDSQKIAYVTYLAGKPQIHVMNADGTHNHPVTGDKSIVNLYPFPIWSPDGRSILFSDFNTPGLLLDVPTDCADPCENAIQPAFNMNGAHLMTTSFLPLDPNRLVMAAFNGARTGGYSIYSFDTQSDASPQRLTTNFGIGSPGMAAYDHWLAFASGNIDPAQPVEEGNLYVLDTNCIGTKAGCAGSLQKVAGQIVADDSISWSYDGHWLAYVTSGNNLSHLNLLDTTCLTQHIDCASFVHPLPITSIFAIRPAWRPTVQW